VETKAPTCVDVGEMTYTCTTCGDIYTEEIAATGEHSYVDGKCTVCSRPSVHIKVNMDNMELGNNLALIFWIQENQMIDGIDYTAKLTRYYADGTVEITEVPESEWTSITYSGTKYYRVKYANFAAKEMVDNLSIQIFDGSAAVSNIFTDSIRDFAMYSLSYYKNDAEIQTLLVDMLNYGAAAQKQFNHNITDLANSYLTVDQQSKATQSVAPVDHWKNPNKIGYSANLELVSNIVMHIWIKNVTSDMYAKTSFVNHLGETVSNTVYYDDFTNREGYTGIKGMYSVPIEGLVVADGNCVVTCELYNGNHELIGTVQESMLSCATAALGNDSNGINDAIMKFTTSSYKYLHR